MADPATDPATTLYCMKCGYNLTGLDRQICPECGTPFDPAELAKRIIALRPSFYWGVFYVVAPPALFSVFVVVVSGFSIQSGLVVGLGSVTLLILTGIIAILAGRRLACRAARRLPSDPANRVTVFATILFSVILFTFEVVLSIFFLKILNRLGY